MNKCKTENCPLDGVGLVELQDVVFGNQAEGFRLDSGKIFGPVNVRYETYGTLNSDKSNAILILHAFSGDNHAAGRYTRDDEKPGWWDAMIGPGRAFDTNKYFIICSNVLGGCQGTTGPNSINPDTGKPYGIDFPIITIHDMVKVQHRLMQYLDISQFLAVAGGSMGGMQALEWAVSFPESIRSAIILASTSRLSAQGIAFNTTARNAIISDPRWKNGNYYSGEPPVRGLAIARMIGHITYLSDEAMRMKFGRKLRNKDTYGYDFSDQFEVESYLQHQGDKFVERFDANSFIYISKAMDYFNLAHQYGSLEKAFSKVTAKLLVVSFSSDWLYPTYQSKEMVYAMMRCNTDVSFAEINCPYGHDSFLLEKERQSEIISSFLHGVDKNA